MEQQYSKLTATSRMLLAKQFQRFISGDFMVLLRLCRFSCTAPNNKQNAELPNCHLLTTITVIASNAVRQGY